MSPLKKGGGERGHFFTQKGIRKGSASNLSVSMRGTSCNLTTPGDGCTEFLWESFSWKIFWEGLKMAYRPTNPMVVLKIADL